MKRNEILFNCPGGWYGNDPGSLSCLSMGNIIFDPARAEEAFTWLRKRTRLLKTGISAEGNGIFVQYELK